MQLQNYDWPKHYSIWLKLTSYSILVFVLVNKTWAGFACLENPCFHGICIDYLDDNSTHQCYCRNGFTGYSCQINWDECRSSPCLNNGICNDGIASFNCSCPDNFAGTLCQYDLSACEELFPCQNNGTCTIDSTSANETFMCICPPGFSGPQCDIDVSVCNTTENVCLNGGQCVDGIGVNFHCKCESGWTGQICEIEVDECISQPCQNGGICVNKLNEFNCACPFGYTGKTCERKLKICEVNPCKNGAFCLHEDEDETTLTCYCVPDYHGTLCEFKYDDCDPPPKCFNGGSCIDGVGEFTCSCPPLFFGPTCQCTIENMTDPSCSYNETVFPSTSDVYPPISTPSMPVQTSTLTLPDKTVSPDSVQLLSPTQSADAELLESTVIDGVSQTIPTATPSIPDYISDSVIYPDSAKPFPQSPYIPISSTSKPPHSDVESQYDSTPTTSIEVTEGLLTPTSILSLLPTPFLSQNITSENLETLIAPTEDVLMSTPMFSSLSIPVSEYMSSGHNSELMSHVIDTIKSSNSNIIIGSTASVQSKSTTPEDDITTPVVEPGISSTSPFLPPYQTASADIPVEPTVSYEFSTVDLDSTFPSDYSLLPPSHDHELSLLLSPTHSSFPTLSPTDMIPSPSPSVIVSPDDSIVTSTPVLQSDLATSVTAPQSEKVLNSSLHSDIISYPPLITTTLIDTDSLLSIVFMPESLSESLFVTTAFVPQPTSIIQTPISFSEITPNPSSSSIPFSSPEPSITLPTPTTLTNVSHPCKDYCYNGGKCHSDSIEPSCICPFKFVGNRCENPRKKFSTVSLTGDSYLGYKVPNESVNRISVKTTMATNAPDGILFYTSSAVGRLYALIFTQGGHITLHFSCGAQSMHFVETRTRIDNGYNFTMEFNMEMVLRGVTELHCVGQVSVNQSYIMRGEQIVGHNSHNELYQHAIQLIYLGGVDTPNAKKNDELISILPGFRGCLYTLSVNQEAKDLYEDATEGKEVSECSAFGCVISPCFGLSKCLPSNRFPFWQCQCSPGFQGARCQVRVCDTNPCMNGATCTFPLGESRDLSPDLKFMNSTDLTTEIQTFHKPICLCPLGFSGSQCQSLINITKPSFKPISGFDYSAFIAYEPIPRFADWVQLKLHFVMRNISQISLLAYSGYTQGLSSVASPDQLDALSELVKEGLPQGTLELSNDLAGQKISDFFAITYVHGYVALTWNLGSGTQRIITPSPIDKRLNVHTLFAGRSGRQAWLKVDGMRNVTGKSPGPFHRLNVNTELFVGGYESFRFEGLPHDLPLHKGFEGCIFDFGFRVKNRLYLPRALRGRNIKNCYEEDC